MNNNKENDGSAAARRREQRNTDEERRQRRPASAPLPAKIVVPRGLGRGRRPVISASPSAEHLLHQRRRSDNSLRQLSSQSIDRYNNRYHNKEEEDEAKPSVFESTIAHCGGARGPTRTIRSPSAPPLSSSPTRQLTSAAELHHQQQQPATRQQQQQRTTTVDAANNNFIHYREQFRQNQMALQSVRDPQSIGDVDPFYIPLWDQCNRRVTLGRRAISNKTQHDFMKMAASRHPRSSTNRLESVAKRIEEEEERRLRPRTPSPTSRPFRRPITDWEMKKWEEGFCIYNARMRIHRMQKSLWAEVNNKTSAVAAVAPSRQQQQEFAGSWTPSAHLEQTQGRTEFAIEMKAKIALAKMRMNHAPPPPSPSTTPIHSTVALPSPPPYVAPPSHNPPRYSEVFPQGPPPPFSPQTSIAQVPTNNVQQRPKKIPHYVEVWRRKNLPKLMFTSQAERQQQQRQHQIAAQQRNRAQSPIPSAQLEENMSQIECDRPERNLQMLTINANSRRRRNPSPSSDYDEAKETEL